MARCNCDDSYWIKRKFFAILFHMNVLWNENIKMPEFPRLEYDLKTDVLIIGGGLTGLLCAYKLKAAGVDCTLIEANRIGRGTSGHTTAKVTAQHGLIYADLLKRFGPERAQMALRANLEAVEQYRKMAKTIDCDFEDQDSFIYSSDPFKLEQELDALRRLGYRAELAPRLPIPVEAGAVKFPGQGQFHPLKFIAAIAKDLLIYEQTAARGYDGQDVITDRGSVAANKIIVATDFPIFNKHGGYPFKLYQHRSYVLALSGVKAPEGMYMGEKATDLSFRRYGDLLLLGGGAHRTGKTGGGWKELSAFAKVHFPGAKEQYRWAAQDCMSLDDLPYIGRYARDKEDLYVATGFNKWGMTSAMVAAELLTAALLGKAHHYAPAFAPDRSILRPQLAVNALETTLNLLTPTAPRCPHLGCALKWNKQEHSWDCPCHGSRFDEKGTLLDGPSIDDMK